jgi:hypothetical protein
MVKIHKITVAESIYDAARRLLASGEAQPEDRIESYRGDQKCLQGTVGSAAQYQAFGMRLVKYNPDSKQNRRKR